MLLKQMEPAALPTRTGPGVYSLAAIDTRETSLTPPDYQPLTWLARRARLTLPTARAVAAANGWGRS